jgi:uncharacterized protein
MPLISRRKFIYASGIGATTLSLNQSAWGALRVESRSFEHGAPLAEFQYGEIQFMPGLHQAQLEQTHSVLMRLSDDSLLKPFRTQAGLAAPGDELGGWYGPNVDGNVNCGHAFGQWLSALSRFYAITGDTDTHAKVIRLVDGFSQTTEVTGKIFARPAPPAYIYDKLVCGLADAHQFAHSSRAFPALAKTTTAALLHLPGRAVDSNNHVCTGTVPGDSAAVCGDESYTLPENQFIAWQRGADARHLHLAKKYLADDFYFDPLARGENVLPGRHAYSYMNALCSAARAYLVSGEERYLRAALHGFEFVEKQSFVTGGWGPMESFLPLSAQHYPEHPAVDTPPITDLGDDLKFRRPSAKGYPDFETPCGAYAHFKLTRYLLRITKDPRFGDSMERIMYNTVLGALPLQQDGRAFYYSDYHANARKIYVNEYASDEKDPKGDAVRWPCCSGTLPQIAADYRISTYFHDAEGVYVNLYIPSTLQWRQGGAQVTLTQSGGYPLTESVLLTMRISKPTEFALRLRIPAWARQPRVSVNGRQSAAAVQTGSFLTLKREWDNGDHIEVELPRGLELRPLDDRQSDVVALVSGPLVLFALTEGATPKVTRSQLLSARQTRLGGSEWTANTESGPLRLAPFWTIKGERYTTYIAV